MTAAKPAFEKKTKLLLLLMLLSCNAWAQEVELHLTFPASWKGRNALLLTREKGFAAIVHSFKLNHETVLLSMDPTLVPDLYQLHVSKVSGSLFFFLDSGTRVHIDSTDLSKSLVTNSRSNPEWLVFNDEIQKPSERRVKTFSVAEAQARKKGQTDSLNYWVNEKALEHDSLLAKTRDFILNHPRSFVSLYLLKNNWYAFKNQHVLEKLDPSLSVHRSYRLLKNTSE
jgi:hypothetical protein